MQNVLMEVLKDRIDEVLKDRIDEVRNTSWNDGKREAYDDVATKMITRGMDGTLITDITGYDRRRIDALALRLNRRVQWDESEPQA